jgi:hypothetical protein
MTDLELNGQQTPEAEPDWKTAFSAVMKQRNDWMNRAQNLELDMFLMEEKIKNLTEELNTLKQAATGEKITSAKHHKAGSA